MFEIRNLTITQGPNALIAGLNLQVEPGDIATVTGASGSGKSTLLNWLVGDLDPAFQASGELWIDGQRRKLRSRAMGLRVIARDGAPVGWSGSVTRNLLRTVDMLPFGYALGLLSSLFDPYGRRLGDLVAGTVVVHAPVLYLPPPPTIDSVLAPPQPLRPEEQAALMAFAERAPRLSAARQQELAGIAEPLTGTHGQVAVLRLYAMANWLLGRR